MTETRERFCLDNLLIAPFLLSLGAGVSTGKNKQQIIFQPAIQANNYGNLHAYFRDQEGRFFMIEFRQSSRHADEERQKERCLKIIESLTNTTVNDHVATSIKGHFLCYPVQGETETDFVLRSYGSLMNKEALDILTLNGIKEILSSLFHQKNEKIRMGCSFREMEEYITLLKSCAKEKEPCASGIFVHVQPNQGISVIYFNHLKFLEQEVWTDHAVPNDEHLNTLI